MIRKIKSRLSVKVFSLTLLLITVCCFITYSFILQAAPKNYLYDMEDAELELSFLPEELSRVEREYAYTWLEPTSEWIEEQYENEFELHFFQSDGQEVSLHDINQPADGQITDFDKTEKTKASCNSERVVANFRESVFKLSDNTPISSVRPTGQKPLKSISAICFESLLTFLMGAVIYHE